MGNAIKAPFTKDIDGGQRFHRFRYHIARGFISPGDKVLDLCCGTGYGTALMAESRASFVTGFDIEESNITSAIEEYYRNGVQFVCTDLETHSLPEADVAVCFEGLEHLKDPNAFIQKLKKKVRKYICFSVPTGQTMEWDEERGFSHEVGDHTHLSVFKNGQEILDMFLDENWKLFYQLQEGVTYIAVVYNEQML